MGGGGGEKGTPSSMCLRVWDAAAVNDKRHQTENNAQLNNINGKKKIR